MNPSIQDLPIRIVCATRTSPEEFMANSMTAVSIKSFFPVTPVEMKVFPKNKTGLPYLYNIAIEEAQEKPAILVFIHDDVFICDYHWGNVIRQGLQKFDIVGIAGNTRRRPMQPGWIITDRQGSLDEKQYLSGTVGQGHQFPPQRLDHFGPAGQECKLLDELMLAADSRTLNARGLRFDPSFSFHFYDLDFCRTAESLELKMGTIPLSVVHGSYGAMDRAWNEACDQYFSKWSN